MIAVGMIFAALTILLVVRQRLIQMYQIIALGGEAGDVSVKPDFVSVVFLKKTIRSNFCSSMQHYNRKTAKEAKFPEIFLKYSC